MCGVDVRLPCGVVTRRRQGRCERQRHRSSDLVVHESSSWDSSRT